MLDDHFASDAINDGVAARAGFVRSFEGEAVEELDQLRADFLRKAVMAGTDWCAGHWSPTASPETLADLPLGDVSAVPGARPAAHAGDRPRAAGR